MKFIFIVAIIFSACCFLSVLNIYSLHTSSQKSDIFYSVKRDRLYSTELLMNAVEFTDENVLRCQDITNKIFKDHYQRLFEEEIQEILFQCSLLLQQNSKHFGTKNENDSTRLSSFEIHRKQEHVFTTEEHSTVVNSTQLYGRLTGQNEISNETATRKENKDNSDSDPLPGKYNDLSTDRILKPTTESSVLWSFFFGKKGSSGNARSLPTTKQNESKSTGKPTENRKSKSDNGILSSANTSWSLWNYFFGARNSSQPSKLNRSFEHPERNPAAESRIHLDNSSHLKNSTGNMWLLVLPGTKWCGSGDTAANDDDLGYFEDVDRCCRAHDKCNDLMEPGESKYNLTNTSSFTLLNCKCDDELYNCLSQIDSVAANAIGNVFFNILGRMCYTLDYPRKCKKYNTLLGCLEYTVDETAEKVYQWKPAKKYYMKPFIISAQ